MRKTLQSSNAAGPILPTAQLHCPAYLCRGLEAIKRCKRVYLEAYTSMLLVPQKQLVRWLPQGALSSCLAPLQLAGGLLWDATHYCRPGDGGVGGPGCCASRGLTQPFAVAGPSMQESDAILEGAMDIDIAFLVVGDPFG